MMRRGFSLLEVVVALGILAVSLFVLVQSQGTAALMTTEAEDMPVATYLAKEKMSQVVLIVESEGFQEQELTEEGDFEPGVYGGWRQCPECVCYLGRDVGRLRRRRRCRSFYVKQRSSRRLSLSKRRGRHLYRCGRQRRRR